MLSLKSVESKISNLISEFKTKKYLLAVSGGADSMVMASIFKDLQLSFEVAHINYKLRGNYSDLDQKTVEDFCKNFNIKFHLYEVSEKDQQPENSIQLWARDLRYQFFRKIQQEENIDFLVTAHHLNDQLETFIINLSKASGLKGLSGIPSNENQILRPLLDFSKQEIYDFAKENKIEFREDLSNKKNDYLRNRIRNEITPKLLETNEYFLQNFSKSLDYLSQTKNFVVEKIAEIEQKITVSNSNPQILSKEKLAKESDFVKFEILKKYGFSKTEEIAKIFSAENGSSFFSITHQIFIHRNDLIIQKTLENQNVIKEELILIADFDFSENHFSLNLEDKVENYNDFGTAFIWNFDAEKLKFPLKLRKQNDGDEFFPSGFSGKKKVSKFLRDEKLSNLARQKIWLICDTENSVLGVIPLRQDRRFSALENTEKVLVIYNKK
ncbi:tRNA(Ile)-lysidine synthetase [Chryseobacterium sp. Leaf404]|uniref:tRNA lysidine(34) synthetase TilS n=1 Tax=unclassified Chryseobacterium TaxID=2593645 RepID=UPI0006FEC214|nr:MULTISPECIES: tRNA lysidine(34) synthetase TilS [unclassified Chryseobacterium]KQT15279.1 tRNA(Ile)-lysidine synthetase [Chryseobacterium sp. Leaf404]